MLLYALLLAAFSAGVSPSDVASLRQPGTPVPAAALPNVAGGTTSLRGGDGKPAVLVVFGSWCDPCKHNMPAILKLAKTSSVRFIGIDALESMADAKAFVAAEGVPFPTVSLTAPEFDGPGVTDDQRGETGIDIPAVYVIDASGKSYKAFVGANAQDIASIRAALSKLATHS